jgi:hypothetical protein
MENKYLEKIALSAEKITKALASRIAGRGVAGIKYDFPRSALLGRARKGGKDISNITKKKIESGELDVAAKKLHPYGVPGKISF